jgi:hypothetical protein
VRSGAAVGPVFARRVSRGVFRPRIGVFVVPGSGFATLIRRGTRLGAGRGESDGNKRRRRGKQAREGAINPSVARAHARWDAHKRGRGRRRQPRSLVCVIADASVSPGSSSNFDTWPWGATAQFRAGRSGHARGRHGDHICFRLSSFFTSHDRRLRTRKTKPFPRVQPSPQRPTHTQPSSHISGPSEGFAPRCVAHLCGACVTVERGGSSRGGARRRSVRPLPSAMSTERPPCSAPACITSRPEQRQRLSAEVCAPCATMTSSTDAKLCMTALSLSRFAALTTRLESRAFDPRYSSEFTSSRPFSLRPLRPAASSRFVRVILLAPSLCILRRPPTLPCRHIRGRHATSLFGLALPPTLEGLEWPGLSRQSAHVPRVSPTRNIRGTSAAYRTASAMHGMASKATRSTICLPRDELETSAVLPALGLGVRVCSTCI